MNIPNNLPSCIKADNEFIYLKIMVTITATDNLPVNKEIEWAVFFGVKGTTAAGQFGSIAGKIKTDRPIFLIPLSMPAKEEAVNARKEGRKPKINCSGLTLRNRFSAVKPWDGYKDWYSGTEEWDKDSILTLAPQTELTGLAVGDWADLNTAAGTWPVWLVTIDSKERMIKFQAPGCRIVNTDGNHLKHEAWVGVKFNEHHPFISINDNEDTKPADFPIIWTDDKRNDDILIPLDNKELLQAENWKDETPIAPGFDEPSSKVKNIIRIFKSIDQKDPLYSWILQEMIDGIAHFRPVYIRSFLTKDKDALQEIIGAGPTNAGPGSIIANSVFIIQVCRLESLQINTRLSFFHFIRDQFEKVYGFLNSWNKKTGKIGNAIQAANAGIPIGIVPRLVTTDSSSSASSNRDAYVSEWSIDYDKCGNFLNANGYSLKKVFLFDKKTQEAHHFECHEMILPLLNDENSGILSLDNVRFITGGTESVNDNGTLFQFFLDSYEVKQPYILRDGALAFMLDSGKRRAGNFGRFRLTLQLAKSQQPFFLWDWHETIKDTIVVSFAIDGFSLPVKEVMVSGQDTLAKDKLLAPRTLGTVIEGFGERSESPLMIPLHNTTNAKPDKPPFLLSLSESVNVSQNHRVDMRLLEFDPAAGNNTSTRAKVIILDSNPQIVAMIDANFLQQPGYDDGAWVLARRSPFSEEAGGWELLDDSAGTEGFQLVLPSQAIGEAYVKGKNENGQEPVADKAIQYRFGAPAILRLSSERLERRYVAAPWNLRRIWGQPGEAAPGIPLLEAQFELLYGLTGNLKPEKAFIAELASKLGDVPVPPVNSLAWAPTKDQNDSFKEAWKNYLKFYQAWQSRLAILEPSVDDNFANASFNKNINFNLRTKLDRIENDVDPNDPQVKGFLGRFKKTGADIIHPINPELNETKQVASANPGADLVNTNKRLAVHSEKGLAGGAVYGFESMAIYNEFLREVFAKGSSSAEVKALAFSSLGGWGKQTAKFAFDKTVIKSNTSMGRTHFYAVERIGRIGVFWNKAKHVIEYERTVVPSLQFKEMQPAHLGRPLVRKVREYIEILEPTRHYPDFATDAPDAPGSVMGCTFKSIIIPVLSSWGHDVWGKRKQKENEFDNETIGWEVPLWKPGANAEVYPKPQITLSLLPPPDADEPSIVVNLSEPENLWFYTDTRETAETAGKQSILITSDVHAWPAVQNVDFSDLPEPVQFDIEPTKGDSPELHEVPMPDVLDILPGFERFTFKVDRVEIPASVAGRYYPGASVTGRMRTVSMMRSIFKKTSNWANSESKKALEALAYLSDTNSPPLLARAANGFMDIDKAVYAGAVKKIDSYLEKIRNDVANLPALFAPLVKDVAAPKPFFFESLWTKAEDNHFSYPAKRLWWEALEAGNGLVKRVLNFYGEREAQLINQLDEFLRGRENSIELAIEILKRFEDSVLKFQAEGEFAVDSALSSILQKLDEIASSLSGTIADSFAELNATLNNLNLPGKTSELKELLKEKIKNTFNSLSVILTGLFDKLKKIKPGINEWSDKVEQLRLKLDDFNSFKEKIFVIVDNSSNEGLALITEIRSEINNALTIYRNKTIETIGSLKTAAQNLVGDFTSIYKNINEKFKEVTQKIKEFVEAAVKSFTDKWKAGSAVIKDEVKAALDRTKAELEKELVRLLTIILYNDGHDESVFGILKQMNNIFGEFEQIVKSALIDFISKLPPDIELAKKYLESWLSGFEAYKKLETAIRERNKEGILVASTALANKINKEFGRLTNEVAQKIREADRLQTTGGELIQTGKQTLNNFRSVWEEFTAPGLGLNRKTVAMIVRTDWKQVEQRLSITPCISRVKQFGEQLEGLGLRLPVTSVTDRLLPAIKDLTAGAQEMGKSLLSKFDFSNLFSDLGGMRLDKLFPGFKMPEFARDKIKITQGFDKQNLMAWVNAEADVQIGEKKKLMSIGPVLVELEKGHFTGKMRMEIDIDGKTKKTNTGSLSGSWHINIAGTGLMIFRDTSIIFKDDKLTFDLDPSRMEMPGLLKMLTDATTKISDTGAAGDKEEPFKIGLVKIREIPAGVRAELNLPPISVGGGTTAITNLSFGGHFELLALDKDLKFKFLVGLGFYLGKREAPFNITIFILGGGGYVDCALTYAPKDGLSIDFVMSLHASVSIAIAVGWMTGFVAIMVGFEGEYHKTPKQGSTVYITIFVRVIGMVDILSLVTVFLFLSMEATYKSLGNGGSQLVGTGQVRLEIRICRFIKIKVQKSYSKVFAGSASSSSAPGASGLINFASAVPAPKAIEDRVKEILKSLE